MPLTEDDVDYFKDMAKYTDVPYQSLIKLYLRDCVMKHRKVQITWPSSKAWQFVQAENSVGRGYAPDGSCPHQGAAPALQGTLPPLHAQHPPPPHPPPHHPAHRPPHPPPPQPPPDTPPKPHTPNHHHHTTPKHRRSGPRPRLLLPPPRRRPRPTTAPTAPARPTPPLPTQSPQSPGTLATHATPPRTAHRKTPQNPHPRRTSHSNPRHPQKVTLSVTSNQ